jgi:hypothetical protein
MPHVVFVKCCPFSEPDERLVPWPDDATPPPTAKRGRIGTWEKTGRGWGVGDLDGGIFESVELPAAAADYHSNM